MRSSSGEDLHWLFIPGGPGLGSESLIALVDILELPGHIWLVDLPGDGSNVTANNNASFSHWGAALLEVVSEFEKVILVAPSTGGMYALSLPQLETYLKGLILLDSAPYAKWQIVFHENMQRLPQKKSLVFCRSYIQKALLMRP